MQCKEIEYIYQEPLMQYGSQCIKLVYKLEEDDDEDKVLRHAEKVVGRQLQTDIAREMFNEYAKRRLAEKIAEQKKLEEEKNKGDKDDGKQSK